MFSEGDSRSFEGEPPQRFPRPSIDLVQPDPIGSRAAISQIYAAAWGMAHRDHELDKLFNFEFYEGRQ